MLYRLTEINSSSRMQKIDLGKFICFAFPVSFYSSKFAHVALLYGEKFFAWKAHNTKLYQFVRLMLSMISKRRTFCAVFCTRNFNQINFVHMQTSFDYSVSYCMTTLHPSE